MSLTTPPKIDWGPEAVADTDMNEIGVNLNALESSKHQDGDSPTYAGVQTDNALLKQKVISGAVGAASGVTIAHGLIAANIRGLSPSVDISVNVIDSFRVNGANINIFFSGSITATCYCVVTYV